MKTIPQNAGRDIPNGTQHSEQNFAQDDDAVVVAIVVVAIVVVPVAVVFVVDVRKSPLHPPANPKSFPASRIARS